MDYPLENKKELASKNKENECLAPASSDIDAEEIYQKDADSCLNQAQMSLRDLHSKPETFDEYLASLPESVQKNLKKFTEHTRTELTKIHDTLEPQLSKPGFENKKHIVSSLNELIEHWDTYIWKICEQLDFKNNIYLISNASNDNVSIPTIGLEQMSGSLYGYTHSLRPHPNSKITFEPQIHVYFDPFKKPFDSAEKLTEALLHETLHAFLYTFNTEAQTNRFLNEGMTTFVVDAIVGKNITGYNNNFALIGALNKLDSNALRQWYTGAMTFDEYCEHIRDILSEYYPAEIVNPLIEKIAFADEYQNRALKNILASTPVVQATVPPHVVDEVFSLYLAGQYDLAESLLAKNGVADPYSVMKNVELTRVNNHPFATEVDQINTIVETITKPEERYSR